MIYCFKRCKCCFDCNATSKNTIIKSYIQFSTIEENLKVLLFIWWYSVVLCQRHWHVLADRQTKPFKCYAWYETKELLTVTKMYIIIIDILMLIISIDIIIIIIIIIITTIVFIISIITIFVKSYWRIFKIRQLSPVILVSHDFWRQISYMLFYLLFLCSKPMN